MRRDTIWSDTWLDADSIPRSAYLIVDRVTRKSDTMDFSPNNDWQLLEPKTDIPRSIVQAVTVQPDKPLDQMAKGLTVACAAMIWVLLPFIVWLKISGRP